MRLQDNVILVTASTRGIGLAIVKKCAEEGAKVYMAARDMERAQEIANTLTGVKCVYTDATKPETFISMVEEVVQDGGICRGGLLLRQRRFCLYYKPNPHRFRRFWIGYPRLWRSCGKDRASLNGLS